MHKAPSVTYPVGPCVWYARALWMALAVVAAAGLGSVVLGQGPGPLGTALALGLWLCAVVVVGVHLARVPKGLLSWRSATVEGSDGEWVWQPEVGRAACVSVFIVWQGNRTLGLRLSHTVGRTHWVWAQAQMAPHDWLALRRALISSALSP